MTKNRYSSGLFIAPDPEELLDNQKLMKNNLLKINNYDTYKEVLNASKTPYVQEPDASAQWQTRQEASVAAKQNNMFINKNKDKEGGTGPKPKNKELTAEQKEARNMKIATAVLDFIEDDEIGVDKGVRYQSRMA